MDCIKVFSAIYIDFHHDITNFKVDDIIRNAYVSFLSDKKLINYSNNVIFPGFYNFFEKELRM